MPVALCRISDQIHFTIGDLGRVVFQMEIDKPIDRLAKIFSIGVATNADHRIHLIARPVETVQSFQAIDHAFICVHGKNRILVTVDKQQGSGGNHRGNPRPRPLERVVQEHAVAVSIDHAVGNIRQQIGHAAHRRRRSDSFIGRCNPEGRGPSAADPGDRNPFGIHVRSTRQIIDAANSIPAFHAGRRVPARVPPPSSFAICSMMRCSNFSQLQRIKKQADITVPCKPDPMGLVCGLVAIAPAGRVTTHVEHGGMLFAVGVRWSIEIPRDVESGSTLVVNHLDNKAIFVHRSRNRRMERCFFRQRPEAQHVEVLFPILCAPLLPTLKRLQIIRKLRVDRITLCCQSGLNHRISR